MDVVIYITDHQGNICAVTDATGAVAQTNDYRPFGGEFDAAATGINPGFDRRYGGKEKDATLASNSYDSVGRLSGTQRGRVGATPGPAALSSSYTYNVRGWLTGINGSLFSETLTYETPKTGSSLPGQWGGNISGVQWGTGDSRPYRYDFAYDLLGRLDEASYGGGNAGFRHGRKYTFDLNGNLTGRQSEDAADLYSGVWLEWSWNSGEGNRPVTWHQQRYNPAVYNPSGPSQLADEAYAYDAVGNRTAVLDTQGDTLCVTRYNLLNLPEEYVNASSGTVNYVYSADGEKLYVEENPSESTLQGTEYAANYRIEDGTVTMIHTDAGYYTPLPTPAGTAPSYTHIWYLKDHLGNNRVLASGRGAALSRYHYDPYGVEISVAPTTPSGIFLSGMTESPYKYGGKEWSATTSTYDFEARYLSPAFHRFTTMDPLCEKYYHISPYVYCADNPVNLVDPDGKDGILIVYPDYIINVDDHQYPYIGHAGVLLINSESGYTRYYEYGRYDKENIGVVRNVPVPNVVIGDDGNPTEESLKKVMEELSVTVGHGGRVEGAYVKSDSFKEMMDFAEGRMGQNADPDRARYSIIFNNCATFASEVIQQDWRTVFKTPTIRVPIPSIMIKQYQILLPRVSYSPNK